MQTQLSGHETTGREQWSSRLVFILAAAGSAVGLGNVWKFPYLAGENGGGVFVLVYLCCILLVGLPVMITEILLGRRGRKNPITTMQRLAQESKRTSSWSLLGALGVVTGILILSFYSVIAGWAVAYIPEAARGVFTTADKVVVGELFADLLASPGKLLAFHTIFMLLTVWVVVRGVSAGLEKAILFLMPALFVILLVLVTYALLEGDAASGLRFLFAPDWKAVLYRCDETGLCSLTWQPILAALGQAFFSLSLGMGAIMVYGSYMQSHVSIAKASFVIVGLDTLIALLAGMAIFPLVFANGLEPASGPGLIFQILPLAFGSMPGGAWIGTLFFVLLVLAAWTSSISLIEPGVAYIAERYQSRHLAASLLGGLCWLLGIGTVLSFNLWSGEEFQWYGMTFFDALDKLTSNILLPFGGLLMALFVGWVAQPSLSRSELNMGNKAFGLWWWLIRFVAPIGILAVFLNAIGLF